MLKIKWDDYDRVLKLYQWLWDNQANYSHLYHMLDRMLSQADYEDMKLTLKAYEESNLNELRKPIEDDYDQLSNYMTDISNYRELLEEHFNDYYVECLEKFAKDWHIFYEYLSPHIIREVLAL